MWNDQLIALFSFFTCSIQTFSSGNMWKCFSTNLRRIDAEILKRIESDEDVANISIDLKLIVPLLEMTDDYLL